MTGFLDLPRELREEVYAHYIAPVGGFVYDPRTRRLHTRDGRPIDVTLMRTCWQIALELRQFIFSANTITFTTDWVDRQMSDRAARFDSALTYLHDAASHELHELRGFITDEMAGHAERQFPHCGPVLRYLRAPDHCSAHPTDLSFWQRWGQASSTHRDFIEFMLRQITPSGQRSLREEDETFAQKPIHPDIVSLLGQIPDPWTIPDEKEIGSLKQLCRSWGSPPVPSKTRKHIKHFFSAAALAIQFLNTLHPRVRVTLRRIVLDESHASVAHSESQGIGLVPFCQENPQLRIERRVNIWNNIFIGPLGYYHIGLLANHEDVDIGCMHRSRISRSFIAWIEEAVVLSDVGMLPENFSLVFHCNDAHNASLVFRDLLEDAAWQRALERSYETAAPLISCCDEFIALSGDSCYFSRNFAHVIRAISKDLGYIRFESAENALDSAEITQPPQQASSSTLDDSWHDVVDSNIEPQHPLPSWKDVLLEYVGDAE